ncbi:heme-binding protein 2-like [Chenopodium quinoa]|uniref:SOUL heme-binding protein n=1 Tax=Chenopodium quinoa TaxID=63459 RepID=A0A803MG18_CHEQI|nr:heme-binding protein 2-like [Chenopodium quinoa]
MEKKTWKLMVAICVTVYLVPSINAIESPHYSVIHSESDFEIRIYKKSTWMSAPVNHLSFHQATKLGFHRLFQYIQGANLNFSRIPMTKPVLTSIVPGAGPLHSSSYVVRFYLPVKFQATPPLPLPELNLKPVSWPSHCVAVRKFSGFAGDSNVVTEAEKLATILGRSQWANLTSSDNKIAYSIAQYNSPFRIFNRVNEVWVNVEGSESDNCMSSGMATY